MGRMADCQSGARSLLLRALHVGIASSAGLKAALARLEWSLKSIHLGPSAVVFDPWNGSGTTTRAASRRGLPSLGFDLNPVMIVVALARLLPFSEASSLVPLGREIVKRSRQVTAITENGASHPAYPCRSTSW